MYPLSRQNAASFSSVNSAGQKWLRRFAFQGSNTLSYLRKRYREKRFPPFSLVRVSPRDTKRSSARHHFNPHETNAVSNTGALIIDRTRDGIADIDFRSRRTVEKATTVSTCPRDSFSRAASSELRDQRTRV